MEPYPTKRPSKYRNSGPALFSLVLLGCGIVFFSIVLIACSFVINYADDFEETNGTGIEAAVQSTFNYTQYWAGIPFLVTGVLVICSGAFQRNRGLTITSVIFCIITVGITLFIICLDGGNWHFWNSQQRLKMYWDAQNGVECTSSANSCVCKDSTTTRPSFPFECDEIAELSSLYGATVGSAILVAFFSTFSVLVITKLLSWKRIRYYRSHNPEDFYMDPTARRTPSVIDLPYAKRGGDYADSYAAKRGGGYTDGPGPQTGPPYKQTVYRNYPY